MRALLLGAGGMLGSDLVSTSPREIELEPRDRNGADVTDARAVATVLDLVKPDVVVNATGFTAVDRAETETSEAFAINANAVAALGQLCAERNIRVIHFSTDYVFDGTATRPYREDDGVAPLSVYGRSKLAGEKELRDSGAPFAILRTQWLFGLHGSSFPRTMWERASQQKSTRVVNDQLGRPTYTVDLARATWRVVLANLTGIYHVANTGAATWFDVAKQVFETAGMSHLLEPCTSAEFPRPAPRPARSVLDTSKFETALHTSLPHWSEALAAFLDELQVAASL